MGSRRTLFLAVLLVASPLLAVPSAQERSAPAGPMIVRSVQVREVQVRDVRVNQPATSRQEEQRPTFGVERPTFGIPKLGSRPSAQSGRFRGRKARALRARGTDTSGARIPTIPSSRASTPDSASLLVIPSSIRTRIRTSIRFRPLRSPRTPQLRHLETRIRASRHRRRPRR